VSDVAPLASVVIPTLDAGPEFARTLAAVRAQAGVGEVELIVLDSESRDGTVGLARAAGARVRRVVRATFNHGHTRNMGAALARGRFVAFLTQDALPADERWLAALVEAQESEAAIGAYSRVVPRPRCSPLVDRQVRDDLVYSRTRQVKRATAAEIDRMAPLERRVFVHFNNVASCVRREAFARAPFPVIEFGEDLAWGERVLRAGATIVFEPGSVVIHSHASSLAADRARHAADARLMRRLFDLPVCGTLGEGFTKWRREVARDLRFVGATSLPWREKLANWAYAPLLRAAQIAGQIEGTRAPPSGTLLCPDRLPRVEEHAPPPAGP
jgi:rhamnosyltransferase